MARSGGDATWFVEIGSGSLKWRILADGSAERHSRDIGLSSGLDQSGELSGAALMSLESAFSDLSAVQADRELGPPVVVASEVMRRAQANQDAVSKLASNHLDAELRVLTSNEEAALSLAAVRSQVAFAGESLSVVDLGAASTELATLGDGSGGVVTVDRTLSFSMPLGGRTLAAEYLQLDPPDPRELSAALSVVELHLDDLRREHRELAEAISSGKLVGLGACVQIAAVEIGVDIADGPDPVAGYILEHEAAEEIFRVLATESRADRLHNPGLLAHHVDGVLGALCIVVELFRQFAIDSIEISTVDMVDGLVVDHMLGDAKIGL